MNKICVILEFPALKTEYDLLLPDYLQISSLTALISSTVNELTNGAFVPTGKELLCTREGRKVLHPDYTLADYGVTNGMRLILF